MAKVLTAPAGFHEISQLSPANQKLAETMTPPKNRLLAVFVSEESDLERITKEDIPELPRYMLLQVYRQLESSRPQVHSSRNSRANLGKSSTCFSRKSKTK